MREMSGKGGHLYVRDVVRSDLKLEVRLRIIRAERDEGLHDLEAPDGVVRGVGLVVVDYVHTSSQPSEQDSWSACDRN